MLNKFCIMYESDSCFALIAKSSFKLFSQLIPTSVSNPTEDYTAIVLRSRYISANVQLYRTSEAPLKLSHVYYNLTSYALHTNR